MTSAVALYIAAIFLPWLSEYYVAPIRLLWLYPPPSVPQEGLFWSFQALISYYGRYGFTDRLLFCDYWFGRSGLYLVWFGVSVFQVLTVVLALIGMLKEKEKRRKLHVIVTPAVSVMAPILCVYQRFKQMETSLYIDFIEFAVGFWVAIVSVILFFTSFLISSWTDRRASEIS